MSPVNHNRTKIIATIGPASMDRKILREMILTGMDVARINSSHGDHAMMASVINTIRSLNEELGAHVAILFDLQGPKIRIGDLLEKDIILQEGATFILNQHEVPGSASEVYIKYPHFHQDVRVGDIVLVDDGKIKLEVSEILSDERVRTVVVHGGPLSSLFFALKIHPTVLKVRRALSWWYLDDGTIIGSAEEVDGALVLVKR